MESLKRFEARSSKAKMSVIEARDTTDPALVTQMLMPLLEAIGTSVEVSRLRKRVRDDVNLQNAELPWRRLPLWLILRVSIQRQLCLVLGKEPGQACYKFLICFVLAKLLEDCAGQLAPELTVILRNKLCRRLAKLEMDKNRVTSAAAVYNQLFDSIGPVLKGIIEKATVHVESAWTNFKTVIARPIPLLPSHADEQALKLSLPNSGNYLCNLLALPPSGLRDPAPLHVTSMCDNGAIEPVTKFTDRYFSLVRLEDSIEKERAPSPESVIDCEVRCQQLAKSIIDVFTQVGDAYDSNPEQMSILIISLFDLWVQMDRCAIRACPILHDYAPAFNPELLDVLHLSKLSSMQRLQDIQCYLQRRHSNCRFGHKTIFSEPDRNCFAARYVEQSAPLHELQQQIKEASSKSRVKKET